MRESTEADFWRDRYEVQHRKVHDMEDVIARHRAALLQARAVIHRLCVERGSTDGYEAVFAVINEALDA